MIFRKSPKHPLPKFPSRTIPTFENLCFPLPLDQVNELKLKVDDALRALVERARYEINIDLAMARQVVHSCHVLLDEYGTRTEKERALIVGAVRYFAIADDPLPDGTFATGLDDDAKIVNHVLEQLGIEESYIYIP